MWLVGAAIDFIFKNFNRDFYHFSASFTPTSRPIHSRSSVSQVMHLKFAGIHFDFIVANNGLSVSREPICTH